MMAKHFQKTTFQHTRPRYRLPEKRRGEKKEKEVLKKMHRHHTIQNF
jgi:hypothetical protein